MILQNCSAKRTSKAFKSTPPWHFILSVTTFIAFSKPLEGLECPAKCTCEFDTTYRGTAIVCSNPDTLTSVPQMLVDDAAVVTSLIISNQPGLNHLSSGTLRNFTHLARLSIKESGLKEFDNNVFDGLKHLQDLDFQNNLIFEYPAALLELANVTKISLQGNAFCQCINSWSKNIFAVNATEQICRFGDFEKTGDLGNLTDSLLKQCAPVELLTVYSSVVVSSGNSIIVTCPLTGMDITWEMENIKSQWQLRKIRRQVEIHNLSEADQFRAVKCKGTNVTHAAQASIFLVSPCRPKIASMFFHGTSFRVILHLAIVGWPLPTVHWEIGDFSAEGERNTSLADIDANGVIKIDLQIQPTPRIGVILKAVVTNSLGSDKKELQIKTGESIFHDHSQLIDIVPEIYVNDTPGPDIYPAIVISNGKTHLVKIVLGTVGGFLCSAVVLALCLIRYRERVKCLYSWKHLKRQKLGAYNLASRIEDLSLHDVMVDNPMYNGHSSTSVKKIAAEKISMRRLIGEGNFGLVFLGECANLEKKKTSTTVAIKTLKGDSSEALRRDFEREAELLTTFKHENIVHLYGVCTEGDNWMLIFEYMEHGDLHKYLRSRAPDTVKNTDVSESEVTVLTRPELVLIIKQIAKGLQFLTAQHFVHRDLATRNCLVGKDLQVKIGDFGLARDIYITDYYKVGNPTMLPYRWLALESIRYGKFTTKSDVWSFGVMMWEVFTYGQKPWCELSIPEMVAKIESGDRLPYPQGCPDEIYQLMLHGCWKLDESERYDMTKICDILFGLDLKDPEYLELVA